jgi:hypothetical protein
MQNSYQDAELIDQFASSVLAGHCVLPSTKLEIFKLAKNRDLRALKDLLEGVTLTVDIPELQRLIALKTRILESYTRQEHYKGQGLSRSEFSQFLELLFTDLRRNGIEIPDHFLDLTYWKKLLETSTNEKS